MDPKIITYVAGVGTLLCLINAADIWQDYKSHSKWFITRSPSVIKVLNRLKQGCYASLVWALLWGLLAIAAWYV